MNRDQGGYRLSQMQDNLLATPSSESDNSVPEEGRLISCIIVNCAGITSVVNPFQHRFLSRILFYMGMLNQHVLFLDMFVYGDVYYVLMTFASRPQSLFSSLSGHCFLPLGAQIPCIVGGMEVHYRYNNNKYFFIIYRKNVNPSDKHMRLRGFLEVFILTIYFSIVVNKTTLKDDYVYCAYILRNKGQRRISAKGLNNLVSKHSGCQAVICPTTGANYNTVTNLV